MNSNQSYSPETLNGGPNSLYFVLCYLDIWWMTLENKRAPLLYYIKLCASFQTIGEFQPELQFGDAQFSSKFAIFCPVWPWNLIDDLVKQKGTSSILHQALCIISNPLVNSNWSYSLEKHSIRVKISKFLSRVTLKFDGWQWKTIWHLSYAMLW